MGKLPRRDAGEISDMRSIQIQVWGASPQVLLATWSRPLQKPWQLSAAQANERAGGTHDAGPPLSIPSVIGPAHPGCLPSLWEGCGGKAEGLAG